MLRRVDAGGRGGGEHRPNPFLCINEWSNRGVDTRWSSLWVSVVSAVYGITRLLHQCLYGIRFVGTWEGFCDVTISFYLVELFPSDILWIHTVFFGIVFSLLYRKFRVTIVTSNRNPFCLLMVKQVLTRADGALRFSLARAFHGITLTTPVFLRYKVCRMYCVGTWDGSCHVTCGILSPYVFFL